MMILGVVVAGAVIFGFLNHASTGRELMPTLFLAFIGAIITVQIIPCILLLGSILKGIITLGRRELKLEVSVHNDEDK